MTLSQPPARPSGHRTVASDGTDTKLALSNFAVWIRHGRPGKNVSARVIQTGRQRPECLVRFRWTL